MHGMLLQLCSEEMWKAIMAQVVTLKIVPKELPEEALTQIFQARALRSSLRKACPTSNTGCTEYKRRPRTALSS